MDNMRVIDGNILLKSNIDLNQLFVQHLKIIRLLQFLSQITLLIEYISSHSIK